MLNNLPKGKTIFTNFCSKFYHNELKIKLNKKKRSTSNNRIGGNMLEIFASSDVILGVPSRFSPKYIFFSINNAIFRHYYRQLIKRKLHIS